MPAIELLDQITIDKIAAGEVVERPSSVVKELAENAIDAGASAITIEIRAGGKELIRITDNGCGISKDMVAKAFWRHSTSKLRELKDLETIQSMGFRGEALSSISAVSQVELLTKTTDELLGCRYLISGGKEEGFSDVGVPDGTTILVKNLFYNTPARSKFLKSDQTEGNYVNTLVEHLALSHPAISFQFISNGAVKLQTSGNGKYEDVIYQIYGREIAKNLLPIAAKSGPYELYGFAGKPVISRGNRNFENIFMNGRFVESKIISKAIEDTYHNHTYLMQHQFPFVVLYLTVDGRFVDVNVHPAKREVRFSENGEVYDFVCQALEESLKEKDLIPDLTIKSTDTVIETKKPRNLRPEPFMKTAMTELKSAIAKDSPYEEKYIRSEDIIEAKPIRIEQEEVFRFKSDESHTEIQNPEFRKVEELIPNKPAAEENTNEAVRRENELPVQEDIYSVFGIEKEEVKPLVIVGQVFRTYWIVEYDGDMYIVDQHAAHEKVNFEKLMKRFEENTFVGQNITPPIVITLSAAEEAIFIENKEIFQKFGFEMDSFGGKEYLISAVPTDLYGMDAQEFFRLLLDEFDDRYRQKLTPDMIEMKLATAACKASVKGGDKLHGASAESLLRQLFALKDPYHCPHGRPTMTRFTQRELEKLFKRIV